MPLNLVLLGESGSGKTSSGNTILGEEAFDHFPSRMLHSSADFYLDFCLKLINGRKVKVIDKDGDSLDDSHVEKFRKRLKRVCQGGLTVYLLVIRLDRRTSVEDKDILERLERALETKIRDQTIILFTHGDALHRCIDEYVRDANPGGRYQENRKGKEQQVEELMGKVDDLVKGIGRSGNMSYNDKVGKGQYGGRYRDQHMNDYHSNTNPHLQRLIAQCGGRYQVLQNGDRWREQRKFKKVREQRVKKIKIRLDDLVI